MTLYDIDCRLLNLIAVAELHAEGLTVPEIWEESQELGALAAEIITPDGVLLEDVWNGLFADACKDKDDKISAIVRLLKTLRIEQDAIKEERRRLAERAKSKAGTQERLEQILETATNRGRWKSRDGLLQVSYVRSEAVIVEDATMLASEYVTAKTEISPNKAAIKAAIKAGENVAGATVEERWNLRIK